MLLPFDQLLLALILIGLPVRAWFSMRALRETPPEMLRALRRSMWTRAVLSQWTLVAAVVALWLWQHRWWSALNVAPRVGWMEGGMLIGIGFLAILLDRQRRALAEQPDVVEKLRSQLAPVFALLPEDRSEWLPFAALAVTAGICEELLFRGYVTWALAHLLPSYTAAALVQALLFGVAHFYQGPRGMWKTAMLGIFLTAVVWMTGTLWMAMLIHALMDLNAGDLAIRVRALTRGSRPQQAGPAGPGI